MNVKYVIGSIVEMVIKIVVFIFIAMFVVRTATAAFDYGFRVFEEKPIDV